MTDPTNEDPTATEIRRVANVFSRARSFFQHRSYRTLVRAFSIELFHAMETLTGAEVIELGFDITPDTEGLLYFVHDGERRYPAFQFQHEHTQAYIRHLNQGLLASFAVELPGHPEYTHLRSICWWHTSNPSLPQSKTPRDMLSDSALAPELGMAVRRHVLEKIIGKTMMALSGGIIVYITKHEKD